MKQQKSVLLIDDDVLYCQLQSIELQEMKIWDNIICIESREEAIAYLSGKDVPELILMDLNMGSMSLEEFIEEIKSLSFSGALPKIIVTSAHFNRNSIQNLKLLGFEDFLTKPITSEKLNLILSRTSRAVD